MKKVISLVLISIMLVSACLVAGAAETSVSLQLPGGKIYSDTTSLQAVVSGDKEVKEVRFKLDSEAIGVSSDGNLDIASGTLTPGNHILEAVAIFDDNSAAVDKKSIKVYKRYAQNNTSVPLGSAWHSRPVTTVTGMFGNAATKESYKVQFNTGGSNFGYTLASPIKTSYGDEIVFGFSVGAENALDFASETATYPNWLEAEIITFGIKFDCLTSTGETVSETTADMGVGINFYEGNLAKRNNSQALPEYTKLACKVGEWNRYEYRYTVGRGIAGDANYVPNKLSIYKDGTLILDNYSIGKDGRYAITKLNGLTMFERGRNNLLYFEDIFLTYKKTDYGVDSAAYLDGGTWKDSLDTLPSASEQLKVKFNKAMDKTSLIPANFGIVSDKSNKTVTNVSVNSDGDEAILTIPGGFEKGESIKLILSDKIADASTTEVGEELLLRFKTEAAPLMPDNAEYTVNSTSALVSAAQLKNGDTVSVKFDLDIPMSESDGVAVYLCIRENKKLLSINPTIITQGGYDLSITSAPLANLTGEGNIELKLIICDDFVTTKPYSMIKLD